jgi:hypothetical protein
MVSGLIREAIGRVTERFECLERRDLSAH